MNAVLTLDAAQSRFIATINDGPCALDPELFDGPADRVLLGLAAHANTISHARLIALEDSFPLLRQHLGQDMFNALCRDFVDSDTARASDNNRIGASFLDFLRHSMPDGYRSQRPSGEWRSPKHEATSCTASRQPIELARIEWAWLCAYHAAEAQPLELSELAVLDEATLLMLPVGTHPSVHVVPVTTPLAAELEGLAGMQPFAILTVRPDAEVRLVPLDYLHLAVLEAAQAENTVLGNLLGTVIELAGETAPLGPVLDLIGAGALVKTG